MATTRKGEKMSCDYEYNVGNGEMGPAGYGCHIDIDLGHVQKPVIYPDCTDECTYADKYEKKEDCKFWREVDSAQGHDPIKNIETAPKNYVQEGKSDPTLLPMDILTRYLVPAYTEGLKKYWRESWRLGFQVSVMIAAAMRHITEFFWNGSDYDQDSEQYGIQKHHLAGAIFSLLCVLQTLETRPELDDRRKKG